MNIDEVNEEIITDAILDAMLEPDYPFASEEVRVILDHYDRELKMAFLSVIKGFTDEERTFLGAYLKSRVHPRLVVGVFTNRMD
jgi:hypothetical protein